MKNNRTPTLFAILALFLLLMLPGYKNQGDIAYFPAPVAKPAVAIYANFAASGLYDQSHGAGEAINEVLSGVEEICRMRSVAKPEAASLRTIAENLINNRILSGEIKCHELFFYFRDPENFALIMNGEFSAERLAELIGKSRVNTTAAGLTATLKSPAGGNERLYLALNHSQLVICPENTAGNTLENLNNHLGQLDEKFAAFSKMVINRPAFAAEVNFAVLEKVAGSAMLPGWLDKMKHFRLITASRISKVQMFVPDTAGRNELQQTMTNLMPALNGITGMTANFSLAQKGSSIFMEAPAGLDLEKAASRKILAFLLHFFAINSGINTVLTAANP